MFPGGPVWINSAERDNVFLSSITDPCLTETKKNEGEKAGVNLFFSFEASDEICLCKLSSALWDNADGWPNTLWIGHRKFSF